MTCAKWSDPYVIIESFIKLIKLSSFLFIVLQSHFLHHMYSSSPHLLSQPLVFLFFHWAVSLHISSLPTFLVESCGHSLSFSRRLFDFFLLTLLVMQHVCKHSIHSIMRCFSFRIVLNPFSINLLCQWLSLRLCRCVSIHALTFLKSPANTFLSLCPVVFSSQWNFHFQSDKKSDRSHGELIYVLRPGAQIKNDKENTRERLYHFATF